MRRSRACDVTVCTRAWIAIAQESRIRAATVNYTIEVRLPRARLRREHIYVCVCVCVCGVCRRYAVANPSSIHCLSSRPTTRFSVSAR